MKKVSLITILAVLIVLGIVIDKNEEAKDVYIESETMNINEEIFTDKELEWIKDHRDKDIYVGVAEDYVPIEYIDENREPKGVGIEIIKKINKLTGLRFKVYKGSSRRTWKEIIDKTFENEIDILPAVSFTEKRSKYLEYSNPYIEMTQVILGHKDNSKLLGDFSDISKQTLVVPKGYWFLDIVLTKNPRAKIIEVESMERALEYISSKKADYTISDIPVFTYYKEQGSYNNIKIIGELKQKNKIFIGVNKNYSELIPIINKALKYIDYHEVYEKACVMPQNTFKEKKLTLTILLLITVLLIAIYYLQSIFRKLIKAKKEAEEANKEKTTLMTNISHDIRTPMTVIIGYTQAILDGEVTKEEDKEKYIKRIHKKTKYLNDIINDFLLVSRLEESKLTLQREEVDINSFIKNIAEDMILKANSKGTKIILDLDKRVSINKEVDRIKLHRAIENIMSNSIKYSDENGLIEIKTELTEKGEIKIIIQDNGMGIQKEDLPYIFNRYYKGKNARPESIGLGLYITKEIINKHNGEIWVESQLNKGTTFYILI